MVFYTHRLHYPSARRLLAEKNLKFNENADNGGRTASRPAHGPWGFTTQMYIYSSGHRFLRCVPVFAGNTHIAGLAMLRNSIKNSSALSAAATVHDVRDMSIFSRHLHPIHQEKTSMMSRVQQLQQLAIQFEKPRGEHIDRS